MRKTALLLVLICSGSALASEDLANQTERTDAKSISVLMPTSGAARLLSASGKFFSNGIASPNPALRILFSRKAIFGERGFRREDLIPLSRLIEEASQTSDPLALSLLLDRCRIDAAPTCDPISLARRWVAIDPTDVVAWIELAAVLENAGDSRGSAESWERAARAVNFREPRQVRLRAALGAVPSAPDPIERHWDLVFLGFFAQSLETLWGRDLESGCRLAERREACAAIATTLARNAEGLGLLQYATRLMQASGAPATEVARYQLIADATLATWMDGGLAPGEQPAADADAPSGIGRANAKDEEQLAIGDVAFARKRRSEMHLTDEEAVSRMAARLNTVKSASAVGD